LDIKIFENSPQLIKSLSNIKQIFCVDYSSFAISEDGQLFSFGYELTLVYKMSDLFYKSREYEEAMKWFKIAIKYNHSDSQFKIGVMYHFGKGVNQDYDEAINWYMSSYQTINHSNRNNGKMKKK